MIDLCEKDNCTLVNVFFSMVQTKGKRKKDKGKAQKRIITHDSRGSMSLI